MGAGCVFRGDTREVYTVGFQCPEERGFHFAGVISSAFVVLVKAGLVGFEVWQPEEPGAHVRLEQGEECFEVFPVGAVVAGKKDCGVETQVVCHADVVADIFEVLPGRHTGHPGAFYLAYGAFQPEGVATQFVDVPVVRRGNNAAVRACGFAGNAVGFEAIQAHYVVGAMGFAQAVGEVGEGAFGKGGFELVWEHAFPPDFWHGLRLLEEWGEWKAGAERL